MKAIKRIVMVLTLALALTATGCAVTLRSTEVPAQALRLASARGANARAATTTYELTATVLPASATNKNVLWSCEWGGESSANVSDYMQLTANGNKATLSCVAPFSVPITVKAVSEDNPSVYKTATFDYYGILKNDVQSTVTCKLNSDGSAQCVIPLDSFYTVGSLREDWEPYAQSGYGGENQPVSYFNFHEKNGAPSVLSYTESVNKANGWMPSDRYLTWVDYYNPGDRTTLYNFLYGTGNYDKKAREHFTIEFTADAITLAFDLQWFRWWNVDTYYENEYGEEENPSVEWESYIKQYGGVLEFYLYADGTRTDGTTERVLWRIYIELG